MGMKKISYYPSICERYNYHKMNVDDLIEASKKQVDDVAQLQCMISALNIKRHELLNEIKKTKTKK